MQFELALVMPVYNEQEVVAEVVQSWREELDRLGIRFQILVLNDGSTDGTQAQLETFLGDSRICVINKPNSGHGPTILLGYRQAVDQAPWVFQTDSDNEMQPSHFGEFWRQREDYDGLFGIRRGRIQGLGRRAITAVSRATVALRFGRGVADVNVPYRLMRSEVLKPIVARIPDDTFAPNVIISGAFARWGARIANIPVPYEGRKTGTVSIVKWKLWKAAMRSFWQTLTYRDER
ncbi:MAG: glycosyltransferase family 2 protein [Pirellulales bacterium]|nr:glycosyltransferase family 2 protein [Pirellulales bacterium]